jgi:hypothetical protein
MAVTAQAGTIGFGPQPAKGVLPTQWFRHRATLVDLAVIDPTQEGAPEVGGIPVPSFPYKTGPMVAGGLTLQPRFEDTLGWLLYGMMGKVTSVENPGASGIYDHLMEMLSGDETYVPWMGFRKHIPRKDGVAATDLGEIYKDCKVLGFTLSLPNDAPLAARVDVLGREFVLDADPASWVWDNTFEHWESIPVACSVGGYLKIDGAELPVVAATVGWQNMPLDPRQEKVYGDPFLEDITVIQRRMTYDMTVKWNNPDLYQQVLTGGIGNLTWSPHPKTGSFEVKAVSSVDMPTEDEPYSLIIKADEVMMSQVGGITLAGNQAIMMRFSGVALEATNYASFTLRNKAVSYDWPVGS